MEFREPEYTMVNNYRKSETVCKNNMCAGCMACVDICQHRAITVTDSLDAYNAVINNSLCVGCNACRQVCHFDNEVSYNTPISWYQGWSLDKKIREGSSSGGVATALIEYFYSNIGEVCSCAYDERKFGFKFYSKNGKNNFAGSKYVKSSPEGIYKKIKDKLYDKKKILFIGLPCQVAALRLFTGDKYTDFLYTVDLICHGTPSPMILELFLRENGYSLETLNDLQFRKNNSYVVSANKKGIFPEQVQDFYSYAFFNGLFFTENCYNCKYARKERISDITIGDSWGNKLSKEEQDRGVSLILCQTRKGEKLILESGLNLLPVDLDRAIKYNNQLREPCALPVQRKKFFERIKKSKSFSKSIAYCYPKTYFKRGVKIRLIKWGLWK